MNILGYRLICKDTTYACGMQGTESIKWIKHFKVLDNAIQYAENEVQKTIVWWDVGENLISAEFGKGVKVRYMIEPISCEDISCDD